MHKDENSCNKLGAILLVEGEKLQGLAPYTVRETEKLLYLDLISLIIKYKGRRHDTSILAMAKHLSSLEQTSHIVLTAPDQNTKQAKELL